MIRLAYLAGLLLLLAFPGIAADTLPGSSDQTGTILCSYWRELPGTAVADLTSARTFPLFPNEQVHLTKLEIPENQEGNFGTVIRGLVHPPQDGDYTFYIASTNQSELWIGPAGPEGKSVVARVPQWCASRAWTASPEQQSKPIRLKRAAACYVEVRHKNGGGDNHLSVAWRLPDGTMEGPIPGSRLSPDRPVDVPAPHVTLAAAPTSPGEHTLQVEVDYLLQKIPVTVKVVLPRGYRASAASPAIVHLADLDLERDPETAGRRPERLMPAGFGESKGIVIVSPQCPEGRNYEQQVTIQALAAAIDAVCGQYHVDRSHLGLSGSAGGGTACWRLALAMPGFFAAVAPVGALEVNDVRLRDALRGTRVRMYTDIGEGFATGRANEMAKLLEGVQPKPEVVYLGERELGRRSAAEYCYSRPEFYDDLLALRASAPDQGSGRSWFLTSLIIVAVAAGAWLAAWARKRAHRAR